MLDKKIISTVSRDVASGMTSGALFTVRPGLDGMVAIEAASCLFEQALKLLSDVCDETTDTYAIYHIVASGKALVDGVAGGMHRSKYVEPGACDG